MTTSNTHTIQLHRVLRAPAERVYRALLDADATAKWLPPNGFTCKVDRMEAKVGGTFKMAFTNFTTGSSHSFGGEYLELVPHSRIRYTDKFDDPNLPGVAEVTIDLKEVSCGTEVPSSRRACRARSRRRLVISAGRNRSFFSENWSKRKFRIEPERAGELLKAKS